MTVQVRLSQGLAALAGRSRLAITVPEETTVGDLIEHLGREYPALRARLAPAVAMLAGRHAGATERLTAGQEVALLLPIAGG